MLINYDTIKINAALQDFFNATGIYMDMLKADFTSVSNRLNWADNRYCKCVQDTPEGKKACRASDLNLLRRCQEEKTLQIHTCHAGLTDVVVPILYDDTILGYILFGQIKTDTDFSMLQSYITSLGLDAGEMQKLYQAIPLYTNEKIQSISNIATMLVKHILLENLLRPDYDESVQKAVSYIHEHLDQTLSIRALSRGAGVSKSVLYKKFHACFQCTVSQYIHLKRVERAAELLKAGAMSVEEIGRKLGFTSTSYFSKIFKKHMGMSPLNYKKSKQ